MGLANGVSIANAGLILKGLEPYGVWPEHLKPLKPEGNGGYNPCAKNMAMFILRGCVDEPGDWLRAKRYITTVWPEIVAAVTRRSIFTPEKIQVLEKVPFKNETLLKYSDTHILVAGYDFNWEELFEIRQAHNKKAGALPAGVKAFNKAKATADLKWNLIRKGPVPGTVGKPIKEQLTLLPSDETVPSLIDLMFCAMMFDCISDRPLTTDSLWTSDSDDVFRAALVVLERDGNHLLKGDLFNQERISADYIKINGIKAIGLASMVKPDLV